MKLIAPAATQLNRCFSRLTISLLVLILLISNQNLIAQQPATSAQPSTSTPSAALTQPTPASDKATPSGIIKGRE